MTDAPRTLVFGTATPFGRRVVDALEHAAITVEAIDIDLDDAGAVTDAFYGEVGGVVYAHFDPRSLEPMPFVAVEPSRWDGACERPLRMFLHVVQAAHAPLARSGGALVCVCPTLALQGGANLAMLAAVAEGQRVLAKSAARQWANDGVRVNIVCPPVDALLDDPSAEAFGDARRGRVPIAGYDIDGALREVLPYLLRTRAVTALTIPLDGGQVTAL